MDPKYQYTIMTIIRPVRPKVLNAKGYNYSIMHCSIAAISLHDINLSAVSRAVVPMIKSIDMTTYKLY